MSNEKQDLNLVVTPERLEAIPLEIYYGINNNPTAQIDYIAHFVTDGEGNYLGEAEAIKAVLGGRTLGDVAEITKQLTEAIEESAVPKQ